MYLLEATSRLNAQTTAKQAFNADTLSTDTLNADTLNALQKQFAPQMEYRFVQQSHLKDARYYEQIIFEDKRIPTRTGSLHDYFNGLIWLRSIRLDSLWTIFLAYICILSWTNFSVTKAWGVAALPSVLVWTLTILFTQ